MKNALGRKVFALLLSCMLLLGLSIPVACAEKNDTSFSENVILRAPVTRTKSGSVSASTNNEWIQGTFYADYSVNYTVSGGMYTINSCTVTYDYFAGYIRGDLVKPTMSYSSNGAGKLTIKFSFQVKTTIGDVTQYSEKMTASGTVSLIN